MSEKTANNKISIPVQAFSADSWALLLVMQDFVLN